MIKNDNVKYNLELKVSKEFNNSQSRIMLSHIGEGVDGDYDKNDQNDKPLLRFDIDIKEDGEWIPLDRASFCTNIPCSISKTTALKALDIIISKVGKSVLDNNHKRICEDLSWMSDSDII